MQNELSLGGSSRYTSTVKKWEQIHIKQTIQHTQYKQYKTEYIQVHILPKHARITKPTHTHTPTHHKTHTYTHPHITKPTHTHTHTLQNKLKQLQYKIHQNERWKLWASKVAFPCEN